MHHRRQFRFVPNAGFTLIELLVVISIIALMMALLLPVMSSSRSIAKQVVCSSNQRQVFFGFSLYAADNRNYYPPGRAGVGWTATNFKNAFNTVPVYWFDYMLGYTDYLGGPYTTRQPHPSVGGLWLYTGIITCPESMYPATYQYGPQGKYLAPNFGLNFTPWTTINAAWSTSLGLAYPQSSYSLPLALDNLQKPTRTYMMTDIWDAGTAQNAGNGSLFTMDYYWGRNYINFRHINKANIQFFDGHVLQQAPREVADPYADSTAAQPYGVKWTGLLP